jgi:hypothetical protein
VSVLAFVALETTARVYVRNLEAPERTEIILLARRTYRDQMAYQPHPFLQFTGRPGVSLRRDEVLGTTRPFNELGVRGPVPDEAKPERTTRIACLGGSTTASGYPAYMKEILQRRLYTSLHSVVNFIVHGVDYSPDYVVFHHAINEGRGRGRRSEVRGDYTHFLTPFQYPSIPDALLIRASVIYRWLKQRVTREPDWAFLDAAVVRDEERKEGDPYRQLSDLEPYERNIRSIVDIALARGITPVLVTQPHSTDPETHFQDVEEHMRQSNTLVRHLAETYDGKVLLVDLDVECTGRNDLFTDRIHMTEAGIELKARAIADVVQEHWNASPDPGARREKTETSGE